MSEPKRRGAWLGVGLGGLLSMLAIPTVSTTAGCIIPDNCIAFPHSTVDVCKRFENAMDLTTGLPLLGPDGLLPEGCECLEQSDADVLTAEDADPDAPAFEVLAAQLDGNARADCVAIAIGNGLAVHETNCMTADEVVGLIQPTGPGACESRFCDFAPEPTFGSCPEDGSLCPGVSAPAAETGDPDDGETSTTATDGTDTTDGTDGMDTTA